MRKWKWILDLHSHSARAPNFASGSGFFDLHSHTKRPVFNRINNWRFFAPIDVAIKLILDRKSQCEKFKEN